MGKKLFPGRWYPLDNAAMVYSAIQRDDYSAVYRFSAVMDTKVDPQALQNAVNRVMPRFPGFQVHLRKGIFWYYFDEDPSFFPKVQPDIANPCQPVRFSARDQLLRVFYYEKRISIELFHALADGSGALVFLKTLVAEYLRQRGIEVPCSQGVLNPAQPPQPGEWEDAYQRYATSRVHRSLKGKPAYRHRGTPEPFYTLNITLGIMQVEALKKAAGKYQATITEYLSAGLIQGLLELQHEEVLFRERPVALVIPVDLRHYFETNSLRNFILTARVAVDPELGDYTFPELVEQVRYSLRLQTMRQELQARITQNVSLQKSPVLRWIPRPLKNRAIALGFWLSGERPFSTTFTNPGIFRVPKVMEEHLSRVEVILGQSYTGPANCAAISCGDTFTFSFSGTQKEADLERIFFRWLVREGVPVKVISNRKE